MPYINQTIIYAIWISFSLLTLTILVLTRQGGFFRVQKQHRVLSHYIFKRTIREVILARRLKFNMQCERGIPKQYIEYLGKIYINPKYMPKFETGVERLLYLYAIMNLYIKTECLLTKRQLIKNAMIAFIVEVTKKRESKIKKIVQKKYYLTNQSQYKVMAGKSKSKVVVKQSLPNFEIFTDKKKISLQAVATNSYINYHGKNLSVKHYIDKSLPIECYDIKSNINFKFALNTKKDKMKYSYSQTSDTYFFTCNSEKSAGAVFVMCDKKEFGTSLAKRRISDLEIYVELDGIAKVFVIVGTCKQEVMATIQKIRETGGQLNYLQTKEEIINTKRIESLLESSHNSRYISGEGLRSKFLATCKVIPTMHLPTITYIIESQEDFFDIVDNFQYFGKLGEMGVSFNIALIYSSQNDVVREIINAFMNTKEVHKLIEIGIFMFFIDKITVQKDVIYYLCKIQESQFMNVLYTGMNHTTSSNSKVMVSSSVSGNCLSVFANNKSNKETITQVLVPLNIGREVENSLFLVPSVICRNGMKLKVTSQKTGHSYNIKLPAGCLVYDNLGKIIEDKGNEHSCDKIILKFEIKIKSYGEKIIDIKKESRDEKLDKMHKISKDDKKTIQSA